MALEDCSLNDLDYVGRWYTWERGNFSNINIREHLDHGVATLSWINNFPSFQVEHLSHSFSDHCPILLDTMKKSGNGLCISVKMFRFEAKWCLDSSFEGLVKRLWNDTSGSIPKKLKRLGHQLQRWSTSRFREDRRNRVELEDKLEFLFNQEPSDENLAKITEVQLGLNLEANKEELF